jgi:hypothetical protein
MLTRLCAKDIASCGAMPERESEGEREGGRERERERG